MNDERCPVCGGEMEPHAVMRGYVYLHCKANPNPRGPTRLLSPALKMMRRHYTKSCIEVKIKPEPILHSIEALVDGGLDQQTASPHSLIQSGLATLPNMEAE